MTISFKLHQLVSQLFVYGGDFDTKDGTGCRDYIHIMDIAKGHVAALKQIVDPTFHGVKIYNLGTGNGVTVLEIVKTFERVTGENIFSKNLFINSYCPQVNRFHMKSWTGDPEMLLVAMLPPLLLKKNWVSRLNSH